jgi:virulence factor Mce-like protein
VQKTRPSFLRIAGMTAFALSVFGLLVFLWVSFGGSVPLASKSYRLDVGVQEAVTLVEQADVRIAGVTVGKVKKLDLHEPSVRTLVTVELEPRYAPIPRGTRAIVRQKTPLGESYIELSPGDRDGPELADGDRLEDAQVAETTEFDEVFDSFDGRTRGAIGESADELAEALGRGSDRDLNAALGNLGPFASDGALLLEVLDEQDEALTSVIRDGAGVLGAINDRRGALRDLVADGRDVFAATAARDSALSETVAILPTFLDETRATLKRVERFSVGARPLVRDLRQPARDLGPTTRDLAALAPDLEATFEHLDPALDAAGRGLPALRRVADAARPFVDELDPFLNQLTPIVATLSFYEDRVAGFLSNGGAALGYAPDGDERGQGQTLLIDPRSFEHTAERQEYDRGNAYFEPNALNRLFALGAIETTDCSNAIGPRNEFGDVAQYDAVDEPEPAKTFARRPGCAQAGTSLYGRKFFPLPQSGRPRVMDPPRGVAGVLPVDPDVRHQPPQR